LLEATKLALSQSSRKLLWNQMLEQKVGLTRLSDADMLRQFGDVTFMGDVFCASTKPENDPG
jgi:hypothetical protein